LQIAHLVLEMLDPFLRGLEFVTIRHAARVLEKPPIDSASCVNEAHHSHRCLCRRRERCSDRKCEGLVLYYGIFIILGYALLAPTTLLAEQHYQTIVDRFSPWPIEVAERSRFRSPKDCLNARAHVKELVRDLGETRIVAGARGSSDRTGVSASVAGRSAQVRDALLENVTGLRRIP
jgi:hypothetical protein